jgi:hypothetical protein
VRTVTGMEPPKGVYEALLKRLEAKMAKRPKRKQTKRK